MTHFVCRVLPVLVAAMLVGLIRPPSRATAGWINEIHYDNTSADVGEFVEIVLEPGELIEDFSLEFYNGTDGGTYSGPTTKTPGDVVNGFAFFTFTGDSIQNGAPDGLALIKSAAVVPGQFLSYEGMFTATAGTANGLMSTDIGVAEGSATPVDFSLQLTGLGRQYTDFSWQPPMADTPGNLNTGQALVPEPSSLALLGLGTGLLWLFARRRQGSDNIEVAR